MLNDIYYNPTKIFFGKDTELQVGEEIAKYSHKILLIYGNKSFKKYGLYSKVTNSLNSNQISYIELGNVKPNINSVNEGIELCRKENINFILAVGGGSVIDSAKAIGIGCEYKGNVIDIYEGKYKPLNSIKVATILTIPGSGSESNSTSVIMHEERKLKIPYSNKIMYPIFSILNPEITFTINKHDTSCGIVDAISHILERYFTNTEYVDCTDRISEGLLKTLMKYAILVKDSPNNYNIRSEIMWACKLSHDNSIGFGRKQDWSSHTISHEIGSIYNNISHCEIISVILLAWMKYVSKKNNDKFLQLAHRLFNINTNLENKKIPIDTLNNRFEHFLKDLEMPTKLHEIGIMDKTHFNIISKNCVKNMKNDTIGNFVRLSEQDILNILEIAY